MDEKISLTKTQRTQRKAKKQRDPPSKKWFNSVSGFLGEDQSHHLHVLNMYYFLKYAKTAAGNCGFSYAQKTNNREVAHDTIKT